MEAFLTASWCIWKQTIFSQRQTALSSKVGKTIEGEDYPTFTKDQKQVYFCMIQKRLAPFCKIWYLSFLPLRDVLLLQHPLRDFFLHLYIFCAFIQQKPTELKHKKHNSTTLKLHDACMFSRSFVHLCCSCKLHISEADKLIPCKKQKNQ